MLSLARARRGLPNAAAFRASTRPDAATTARRTTRGSVRTSPGGFVKNTVSDNSENVSSRKEAKTTKSKSLDELPVRPRIATRISATRTAQRGKLVGDLPADHIDVMTASYCDPVAVRPPPTVMVFSNLADNTTVADVLLSIRKAFTERELTDSEARVIDAYLHKRDPFDKSASVVVEFLRSSGAGRFQKLSQAGQVKVRGLVPRTALYYKGPHTFPGPKGEEETTPSREFVELDSARKTKNFDHLRLQNRHVQRTFGIRRYNPLIAAKDEQQLRFNAEFSKVLTEDAVGKSEYEQDWEAEETTPSGFPRNQGVLNNRTRQRRRRTSTS